jgi:hypothetical protein
MIRNQAHALSIALEDMGMPHSIHATPGDVGLYHTIEIARTSFAGEDLLGILQLVIQEGLTARVEYGKAVIE